MSQREEDTDLLSCVWASRVEGFNETSTYTSWASVLVLACKGCYSLVDNFWLIDNNQEFIDNVRNKYLLINER